MRYAISAVAAASGVLLLGLSFYGQPAVYLRQAGEEWDALMDQPAADQPAAGDEAAVSRTEPATSSDGQQPASDVVADRDAQQQRAAQLQQEVIRLQRELAARQQAAAAVPAPQVAVSAPPKASPPPVVVANAPPPAGPAAPVAVASAPSAAETGTGPGAGPTGPAVPAPSVAAVAKPEPPAVQVLERREAGVERTVPKAEQRPEPAAAELAKSEPAKAETAKPETAKPEPVRVASARSESPKFEPPRAAAAKVVAQKPIPAPPPLPQPTPQPVPQQTVPQQQADAAESVLARLRQVMPGAPPAQQVDAPTVQERPRTATSPAVPKLNAARSALANGQIDNARRLLQQAQLQLVFGPADTSGGDPALAARGAADVAHALDALSGNDVRLSRRYVDVAVGDLSGSPTDPPIQETMRRASGYAPAYPPR